MNIVTQKDWALPITLVKKVTVVHADPPKSSARPNPLTLAQLRAASAPIKKRGPRINGADLTYEELATLCLMQIAESQPDNAPGHLQAASATTQAPTQPLLVRVALAYAGVRPYIMMLETLPFLPLKARKVIVGLRIELDPLLQLV